MAGEYQITLATPAGVALTRLPQFLTLEYVLNENDVSPLTATFPASKVDASALAVPDGRLYIERAASAALPFNLEGNTCFFIRRKDQFDTDDGAEVLEIECLSANHILDSAIVAYNVGNSFTLKLDFCDDMMKSIVRENRGALATDTARDISDFMTVQLDASGGPMLLKEFARRNVLKTLQEISAYAAELGTWVGFNVVVTDAQLGLLEFQTYINQQGVDRTLPGTLLVVGKPFNNLVKSRLSLDYTQERNFIYAAGQGANDTRAVQTAEDETRIGLSPFNRREFLVDAPNTADLTALTNEAETALRENRPRQVFTGDIVETPQTLYGDNYQWGDLVQGVGYGQSFPCRVNRVHVKVAGGEEKVMASIRNEPLPE